MWKEDKGSELMDQELADSLSKSEVMRCINVGLLCIQDHAADRPTMSTIVLMVSSKANCPQPKQPTFTFQNLLDSDLGSQSNKTSSVNQVTVSMFNGQ